MNTKFYDPRAGLSPRLGSFGADCPYWDMPFDPMDFEPSGSDCRSARSEEFVEALEASPMFAPSYNARGVERVLASPTVRLRFDEHYVWACGCTYRRLCLRRLRRALLSLRFRAAFRCWLDYLDAVPQ